VNFVPELKKSSHARVSLGLSRADTDTTKGANKGPGGIEENQLAMSSAPGALPAAPRSTPGRRRTFPIRLHTMLSDAEANGQTDIISWQPHGKCFLVRDTEQFVEKLLPKYFNQHKWSSFQRQLNLYSFERITAGIDRGAYYHPKFIREDPSLCHSIVRTKVKGTKVRVPADITKEPNFYTQPDHFFPGTLQPQLGLAGLEHLLYPPTSMQMPTLANAAMLLQQHQQQQQQQPYAAAGAASTGSVAFDPAFLQSLGLANPQSLQPVNPAATQALLARQLGLVSNPLLSMPGSSMQNIDLLRQLSGSTNTAFPAGIASLADASAGILDGNVSSNPIPTQGLSTVGYASVPSQESSHPAGPNQETTYNLPGTSVATGSTDVAEPKDEEDDSKPAAVDRTSEQGAGKDDSTSQLPRTTKVGDRTSAASSAVTRETVGESGGAGEKTTEEGSATIHNTSESEGKPPAEGNVNRPLADDQEMGKFLKRYFD
jgi:hypothetical protein